MNDMLPGSKSIIFSEIDYHKPGCSLKSIKAGTAHRPPPTAHRPPPTAHRPPHTAHPSPPTAHRPGDLICVEDPCALRPRDHGAKRIGASKNVPKGDSTYVVSWLPFAHPYTTSIASFLLTPM